MPKTFEPHFLHLDPTGASCFRRSAVWLCKQQIVLRPNRSRPSFSPIPALTSPTAVVSVATVSTSSVSLTSSVQLAHHHHHPPPSSDRIPTAVANHPSCDHVCRNRSAGTWLSPYVFLLPTPFLTTLAPEASSTDQTCYLPGPFTVEVSQILKLKNPNKSPVAFKVGLCWVQRAVAQ